MLTQLALKTRCQTRRCPAPVGSTLGMSEICWHRLLHVGRRHHRAGGTANRWSTKDTLLAHWVQQVRARRPGRRVGQLIEAVLQCVGVQSCSSKAYGNGLGRGKSNQPAPASVGGIGGGLHCGTCPDGVQQPPRTAWGSFIQQVDVVSLLLLASAPCTLRPS
jgi:hypothetical protein